MLSKRCSFLIERGVEVEKKSGLEYVFFQHQPPPNFCSALFIWFYSIFYDDSCFSCNLLVLILISPGKLIHISPVYCRIGVWWVCTRLQLISDEDWFFIIRCSSSLHRVKDKLKFVFADSIPMVPWAPAKTEVKILCLLSLFPLSCLY